MPASPDSSQFRLILLVFADGVVEGHHPAITKVPQGFSSVVASNEPIDRCVGRALNRDDEAGIDVGDGSYLVTATLHCLGLSVRPGASVAFLRLNTYGQASIVYHQAGPEAPVPPDARNTAVVAGWQGTGWAEPARARDAPDDAPPTDWPINAALRRLGVDRGHYPDEITALGLPLDVSAWT